MSINSTKNIFRHNPLIEEDTKTDQNEYVKIEKVNHSSSSSDPSKSNEEFKSNTDSESYQTLSSRSVSENGLEIQTLENVRLYG